MKRHSLFRGFVVSVLFSRRTVKGELSKIQGTGTIMIRPDVGKRSRRR